MFVRHPKTLFAGPYVDRHNALTIRGQDLRFYLSMTVNALVSVASAPPDFSRSKFEPLTALTFDAMDIPGLVLRDIFEPTGRLHNLHALLL